MAGPAQYRLECVVGHGFQRNAHQRRHQQRLGGRVPGQAIHRVDVGERGPHVALRRGVPGFDGQQPGQVAQRLDFGKQHVVTRIGVVVVKVTIGQCRRGADRGQQTGMALEELAQLRVFEVEGLGVFARLDVVRIGGVDGVVEHCRPGFDGRRGFEGLLVEDAGVLAVGHALGRDRQYQRHGFGTDLRQVLLDRRIEVHERHDLQRHDDQDGHGEPAARPIGRRGMPGRLAAFPPRHQMAIPPTA